MVDNGPEIAKFAVGVHDLLRGLGEMGASLLAAAPPAGGGPWATARIMLSAVPPVVSDA